MTNTFYSVSAPAGSGKTYALVEHAIALAQNGQKVLIAQPSKALIDQTERDIRAKANGLTLNKIVSSGSATRSSVVTKVLDTMKASQPGAGEILLISQQALGRLPNAYRQFWTLFVDEVPGAFQRHEMNIAKSHKYITEHLTLGEAITGQIMVVEPHDVGALRELAANKSSDRALALFKLLTDDILNEDKVVCVNADAYASLVSDDGKRKSLDFLSFQRSEYVKGFASVTVLGANFDETELYKIWEKLDNITWKPHPVITSNLRYQTHTNGSRLTIKYVIDGNWSQNHAAKLLNDKTVLDSVCAVMEAELGQEFLWQANKKHDYLFEYGDRLPQVAHGINRHSYQNKHGVALVKAINHSSGPAAFLKEIGLTQEELKVTLQYQNEYQAMMRCSLRNPQATEPVTVCVVSEGSARWIAKHFPGCTVEKLVSDIPEPRSPGQPAERERSTAERVWDSRENKKVRDAAARGEVYEARQWTPKKPTFKF